MMPLHSPEKSNLVDSGDLVKEIRRCKRRLNPIQSRSVCSTRSTSFYFSVSENRKERKHKSLHFLLRIIYLFFLRQSTTTLLKLSSYLHRLVELELNLLSSLVRRSNSINACHISSISFRLVVVARCGQRNATP